MAERVISGYNNFLTGNLDTTLMQSRHRFHSNTGEAYLNNVTFSQDEKGGKKDNKNKLAKELSRCVNYVSSVGFKGFEHAKENCK